MDKQLLDIYTDYLICSLGATTATGLSNLLDGTISHDKITRFLAKEASSSSNLWHLVKPIVRKVQSEEGILIFDDTIEPKPYTDESELICWHFDHSLGKSVKGINLMTALYHSRGISVPVAFELIKKTQTIIDQDPSKPKRKCPYTKNEYLRQMLQACLHNQIPFQYVLCDVFFASAENMRFIKETAKKDFIMPLKQNRKVALSYECKRQGRYVLLSSLTLEENTTRTIWLEGLDFPVLLTKVIFKNKDSSTGILYLVTSDLSLAAEQMKTIYHKRWKVEEYHKCIKSNTCFAKSPTKTVTTQSNHCFASIYAFTKLTVLSVKHKINPFAFKARLQLEALKQAYRIQLKLKLEANYSSDCA